MSFLITGAVDFLLGKALEKGGEKLVGISIDKSADAAAPYLKSLYRKITGKDEFSDLVSSEERRIALLKTLRQLRAWVNAILLIVDTMFEKAGQTHRRLKADQALEIINRLEEKQVGFGNALEQAQADYPSLLPLIGYLILEQQSPVELNQLVKLNDVPLDETFMFMTYVPAAYSGRMGFIYRGRNALLSELASTRQAVDEAKVPLETILAIRSCERLSLVLKAAICAAETVISGNPKVEALPRAVRVVGRFLRAEAAANRLCSKTERLRSEDAAWLHQIISEAWQAMGNSHSGTSPTGCHESLAYIDQTSTRLFREIRRLGKLSPSPQ